MRQRLAEYRVLRADAVPVNGGAKIVNYIGSEAGIAMFFSKFQPGAQLYSVGGLMICGEITRRGLFREKRELHILHVGRVLHEERMK